VEKTTCEWYHDVFLEALLGQLTSLGCNPNFRDESRTASRPALLADLPQIYDEAE
jgi:hypothetical protein